MNFAKRRVEVDSQAYYDLIFYQTREWCRFLMESDGWRFLDEACRWFHPDHVEMLAHWATKEAGQLPEGIRKPVDGTVRDLHTLMVFLAAALRYKVAITNWNGHWIGMARDAPRWRQRRRCGHGSRT